MEPEAGLIITLAVAILAIGAALLRLDATMTAVKDGMSGLNTNILLLIQQTNSVVEEMRRRRSE